MTPERKQAILDAVWAAAFVAELRYEERSAKNAAEEAMAVTAMAETALNELVVLEEVEASRFSPITNVNGESFCDGVPLRSGAVVVLDRQNGYDTRRGHWMTKKHSELGVFVEGSGVLLHIESTYRIDLIANGPIVER